MMNLKQFFFQYRSYTPIPIALFLIYNSAPTITNIIIGATLIAFGELIRIRAVQYAGGATRTRKVGAPSLCSSGPYAFCRNPLYCGNVIIYTGFSIFAGGYYYYMITLFVVMYFIFQYYFIISLEEETLMKKFGNDYVDYKNNVPSLLPRLIKWENNDNRIPISILKTLKTEKRSLQNIIFAILLIILNSILL